MPSLRFSVADIEVRLHGPDLEPLVTAAQLLLPLLAAVDREAVEEPEEKPPIGFSAALDLDPDRDRRTDPVWYDDE